MEINEFKAVQEEDVLEEPKNQLVTWKLFSPLHAVLYETDEYSNSPDYPIEISSADLCDYEKEILRQIGKEKIKEEGERGLASYLDDQLLEKKVHAMNPTVESWQGELWGVLEVQSYGTLTADEQEAITEAWKGQAADGWGEGFEQHGIRTEAGELYVSFWSSERDYFILPEEKLKENSVQSTVMTMG